MIFRFNQYLLKDERKFSRQLRVNIKEDYVVITAPVTKEAVLPQDYINEIFVHIGDVDALTLSNGHIYGAGLSGITNEETERLNAKNSLRGRYRDMSRKALSEGKTEKATAISLNNLGKLKYQRQKDRKRKTTENFINAALNKMLAAEKPCRIIITHPVKVGKGKKLWKSARRKLSRSFRGFIRERLQEKCEERSIEVVRISSKNTMLVCSNCGKMGKTSVGNRFHCDCCGYETTISLNEARNIEKKYMLG